MTYNTPSAPPPPPFLQNGNILNNPVLATSKGHGTIGARWHQPAWYKRALSAVGTINYPLTEHFGRPMAMPTLGPIAPFVVDSNGKPVALPDVRPFTVGEAIDVVASGALVAPLVRGATLPVETMTVFRELSAADRLALESGQALLPKGTGGTILEHAVRP